MPTKITAICHFCVRLTASLPPVTVYTMTSNPMNTMIEIQPPAQHRGENDGGCVDGHSRGEAALQQKQPRAEETGLPVKAPA